MALKVLLVSEYFPPKIFGGGEISAEHLAYALANEGNGVCVLTSKFSDLEEFEIKNGVEVYRRIDTGKGPKSIISSLKRRLIFPHSVRNELMKLDNEKNFDVIHFLNTNSITPYEKKTIATINSYGNFCPKGNLFYKDKEVCSGCNLIKFIGCISNSEYAGKIRLGFWLKFNPVFWLIAYWNFKRRNKLLKDVDKFIAVSDFIKKMLLNGGISEDRIEIIHNVISIKKSGNTHPLNLQKPILTYIGVLEKIKGVDLLIEAFNQIDEKATLLIVGDGPEREKLEKMADKRVKFLGSVGYEEMPSIYGQSDAVITTPKWPEPLPRVLIEACYFGKPIIATNVGGNKDCVVDGKNGILVKPHVSNIKNAIEKLLFDEKNKYAMEMEGKNVFKERFNPEDTVNKILKLYRSINRSYKSGTRH